MIDSQRYGDTKGATYDEIVNITLGFVFFSEIDDVNSDFFYCKK